MCCKVALKEKQTNKQKTMRKNFVPPNFKSLIKPSAGGKSEASILTAGGSEHWHSHVGKKLSIIHYGVKYISCNPKFMLLGMYPKKPLALAARDIEKNGPQQRYCRWKIYWKQISQANVHYQENEWLTFDIILDQNSV